MQLPDPASAIPGRGHQKRQRTDRFVTGKMMDIMSQSQLAVGMIVQSAEYDRSARAATRRRAIGPGTPNSLRGKSINVGCLHNRVTITTKLQAQVIGNNHDDIFLVSPLHRLSDQSATQKHK